MYKIDRNKWLAAVAAAKGDAAQLTLLYAIRAQGRGRQHLRRVKLTVYELRRYKGVAWSKHAPAEDFAAAGGRMVIEMMLEDQARVIGDAWKQFELVEEKAV